MIPNLNFIREYGVNKFIEQQERRIKLLEAMIKNFDDGRSRSFFCKAAALLHLTSLESVLDSVNQRIKMSSIKPDDMKTRAKLLRNSLNEAGIKVKLEIREKRK
jgi:hypothetical protein